MAKGNTPQPWERQPEETTKAFEAFCIYRDMGQERSAAKVAEKLSKSEQLMKRWSYTHGWVERAAKWDDEQDRIERETAQREQAKAIKKMRKQHADLGYSMLIKAAQALKSIPIQDIKPSDVSRMVEVGSKLERISRGDVGEVVEERDGGQATPTVTFYMPSNGRDEQEE